MVWWVSPCLEQVVRFPHVVPTANSRFRLWWSVVASHVQRVRVHLRIPCQPGLDVRANPTLLMRVLALPMRGSHVHEGVLLRSKLQQKQARRAYGPSWNECVFSVLLCCKRLGFLWSSSTLSTLLQMGFQSLTQRQNCGCDSIIFHRSWVCTKRPFGTALTISPLQRFGVCHTDRLGQAWRVWHIVTQAALKSPRRGTRRNTKNTMRNTKHPMVVTGCANAWWFQFWMVEVTKHWCFPCFVQVGILIVMPGSCKMMDHMSRGDCWWYQQFFVQKNIFIYIYISSNCIKKITQDYTKMFGT